MQISCAPPSCVQLHPAALLDYAACQVSDEAAVSSKTLAAAAISTPGICCQSHKLRLQLPLSLRTDGQRMLSALTGISQAEQ